MAQYVACRPAPARLEVGRAARRGTALIARASPAKPSLPPTVSETKAKFLKAYSKPVNPISSAIVNELLVQQHLWRYQKRYQYDEVFAVGVCSIFDQVLEELPESEQNALFKAYVTALNEDPAKYRADAKRMEAWASELANASGVQPDASGDEGQKTLGKIAERIRAGDFYYTRFFAIGLFRLLELAGASSPEALKSTVASMGVDSAAVTRDLNQYKSILSKLSQAKEMMKEFLERERRKTEERRAEKAKKESDAGSKKEEVNA